MIKTSRFDRAYQIYLSTLQEAATRRKIVLHEDAIAQAKNAFIETCLRKGIPNDTIAKMAGNRYIQLILGKR